MGAHRKPKHPTKIYPTNVRALSGADLNALDAIVDARNARGQGRWSRDIAAARQVSAESVLKQLEQALQCKVYACQPRKPWQRAINEYTNGLLRQYFPKGSDAAGLSAAARSSETALSFSS